MPNDISIPATPLIQSGNDAIAPVRPAAATTSTDQAASPQAPPQAPPSSSPNPVLQLDAALGLVVIEFRNAAGTVTSSIPSQQQLDAYRLWQTAGIGSPPYSDTSEAGSVAAPGRPTAAVPPPAAAPAATPTAAPAASAAAPGTPHPLPGGDSHPAHSSTKGT